MKKIINPKTVFKIFAGIISMTLITGFLFSCSGNFLNMALEEEPPNDFFLTRAAPQANTIIRVYFTYSLDYETALNPSNYKIDGLDIAAVNQGVMNNTVVLTTSSMEKTGYTLEVSGIFNSDLIEIHPDHSSVDFTGLQTLQAGFVDPPPKFTNRLAFDVYVEGDYADAVNYRWKLVMDPAGLFGAPEIIQDWSDIMPIADPVSLDLVSGEVDYRLSAIVQDEQGVWQGIAAPTDYDFTLDSTPPDALSFSNLPDDVTNFTNTEIYVVDRICGGSVTEPCNDNVDITYYRYRSRINSGNWSVWGDKQSINDPITLQFLQEGSAEIQAVGADFAENWQLDADTATEPDIAAFFSTHIFQTYSWMIDTTPPSASFVPGTLPASTTSSTVIDISVSRTGDIYYYKYKLEGLGQADIWSDEKPAGTLLEGGENITETDLQEGNYVLKVIAGDCAGNWQAAADAATYSWTIDLSAPTALLGGTPANPTKNDALNVNVTGSNVDVYKWVIVNDTTACPTGIGSYSPGDTDISMPINDNSDIAEGINTLCVVGGKDDGAGGYLYQGTSDSEVSKHTWTFDMTAPTADVLSWITPASEPDNTVVSQVRVLIGGADVVSYKYIVSDTGSCPGAAVISSTTERPVSQQIQEVGLATGPIDLCIIGRDLAGNWQGIDDAQLVTGIHYNVIAAPQPGDGGAGFDYVYDDRIAFSWTNPSTDMREIRIQICSDSLCNVPLSGYKNGLQLCSDAVSCAAATSYQYPAAPPIGNQKGAVYFARLRIKDQFGNQSGWGTPSDGKIICGGITGVVKDTSGVPVDGAAVELWTEGGSASGTYIGNFSTGADGVFTFSNSNGFDVPIAIASDGYVIEASHTGRTGSKAFIDVTAASVRDIGTVYILAAGGDQFRITGSLVDATTGNLLSLANATVSLYDWNGALVCDAPDITGEIFSFDPAIPGIIPGNSLPSGVYSIIAEKPGYYDLLEDQIVLDADTDIGYLPMAEVFAAGSKQVKVVLTWNDVAKDLDLHLVGEQTDGCNCIPNLDPNPAPTNRFHVYFMQRYCAEPGTTEPYGSTSLIMDDTYEYGPEIVNLIDNYADGDYKFSVFNYDTVVSDWNDVKAVIRIYAGDYFGTPGLISKISVPDNSGSDTTWKAVNISISGTTLTITPGASFLNLTKSQVQGTGDGTPPDPDDDPGLTNLDW